MTTITLAIPQVLDRVCREHYGYVETVLDANPGPTNKPVILPAGTTINLPDVAPMDDTVPLRAAQLRAGRPRCQIGKNGAPADR